MTDFSKFSQPFQPWPFDPRVKDLLERFLRAAKKIDKSYAVGGALAMAAYGYVRQTSDVDAFLQNEDRVAWARALRDEGLRVTPIIRGIHHVASMPGFPDDVRIDLLFPADDPDWSAVQFPEEGRIGGLSVEVFPLNLLVAAKFQSDREDDHADVDAMNERGLFKPAEVVKVFLSMHDEENAEAFRSRYGR